MTDELGIADVIERLQKIDTEALPLFDACAVTEAITLLQKLQRMEHVATAESRGKNYNVLVWEKDWSQLPGVTKLYALKESSE